MSLEKIRELLKELDIEVNIYEEIIYKINLKEVLSSLDFLKLIIKIEEEYKVEFNERILKENIINFKTICEYIEYEK